ncbi:MAG: acyl-CoA dehydrogenase family protein [Burkholderiales bacterium]
MATPLPAALAAYLDANAAGLDAGTADADALLPALCAAGLPRIGVPEDAGGDGTPVSHGIDAIAAVAERSLAAAFVLWGHRVFAEYLVRSPNAAVRERLLAATLDGRIAGATGLSNAMKALSGIEALAVHDRDGRLDGRVPWATNLRPPRFVVAVAVERRDGGSPYVTALPSERPGLVRSEDLDLIALRGTRTASLDLADVAADADDRLADDARAWLPRIRPAFLGLQCGLPIGVARASLQAARDAAGDARRVLREPIESASRRLADATRRLREGVDAGRFVDDPAPLFELRIALVRLALEAVTLELQASGGRAYHRDAPLGFARRWAEAAFLPIVTPSVVQLQGELDRRRASVAA